VEGIPVFTGEFGVANDRNAIKIIATHPPGKRPNVPVIQETSNE
jgi:flagellar motor switch protein FliM